MTLKNLEKLVFSLEESVKENPKLSRRAFLLGAIGTITLGACATIPKEDLASLRKTQITNAKDFKRKGADIFYCTLNPTGFSDFRRHLALNALGGPDFDIKKDSEIYPAANGVVTQVNVNPVGGKYVCIYHGLYWSSYQHLSEQLIRTGQNVTRKDRIAIGGNTGEGAQRSGLHLHFSWSTNDNAKLIDSYSYKGIDGYHFFDPVDFAAFKARDNSNNKTLPYWYGTEIDGPLDEMFSKHYETKRTFFDNALKAFPSGETERFYSKYPYINFDRRYGVDEAIGEKVLFLYEKIKNTKHPFNQQDAQHISNEIKDFLSFAPMITAPKRNLDMPELYR